MPNAFGGDTDDEIDEDELDIVADTVVPLKSGDGGVGGGGAVGEAPYEDEDSDVDGDLLLGRCCLYRLSNCTHDCHRPECWCFLLALAPRLPGILGYSNPGAAGRRQKANYSESQRNRGDRAGGALFRVIDAWLLVCWCACLPALTIP
jgi:hypothetical protein